MSSWFSFPSPRPQADFRLFCFPYAGAGPGVYQKWPSEMPGHIEVCIARTPGGLSRLNEPSFADLLPMVRSAADAMRYYLDKPFALFGHSMGALVCFELARRLRQIERVRPVHLVVSGCRPPHLRQLNRKVFDLPEDQFLAEIARWPHMRASVLASPDLRKLVVPILRADLRVCQTYNYRHEPPLDCPITAIGGTDDPEVEPESLEGWRSHTTRYFEQLVFPGGHLFVDACEQLLLPAMAWRLTQNSRNRAMNTTRGVAV